MKHLKSFKEAKKADYKELDRLCKDYLAYLIDMGFEVKVIEMGKNAAISIEAEPGYKWVDIKDHIIPFLILIKDDYKLFELKIFFSHWDPVTYNIDDVIKDDIDSIDNDDINVLKNLFHIADKPINYIDITLS
jgi:hypothetical protein